MIGNFLYWVGFVLAFSGFYILYQWDVRKIIGGRSKPFIMAGSLMVLGILLMIVGFYFSLIIRPFIG